MQSLLPKIPSNICCDIQHLWDELVSLNTIASKSATDITTQCISEFESRARQWGEDFLSVYRRKHLTPYIHALMNHVGEFLKIHGSILPFTQGLEKNDVLTKSYFRSSNHQGEVALRQILEKQNRIEHLETIGVKKVKLMDIHCSNCRTAGHNRPTCSKPCKLCGFEPYCEHLVV